MNAGETWWVVYRRKGRATFKTFPIAAFLLEGLAKEWTQTSEHRKQDLIYKKTVRFTEPPTPSDHGEKTRP